MLYICVYICVYIYAYVTCMCLCSKKYSVPKHWTQEQKQNYFYKANLKFFSGERAWVILFSGLAEKITETHSFESFE